MSIIIDNQIVRNTQYTLTWRDLIFNQLMNILYQESTLKTLTDKGWKNLERGRDSMCQFKELYYWQSLAEYFILMKDQFYHIECPTEDDITDLIEEYDIPCLRKTVLCRGYSVALFDKLYQAIGISTEGLGNETEGDDEDPCTNTIIV